MKYVVFTDVDGTIYQHWGGIPSEDTKRDIKEAQDKGIEIVLNTGNGPFHNMTDLAKSLNIRYLINSNGASIFDVQDNKSLFNHVIPKDVANEIVQMANELQLYTHWWDDKKLCIGKYFMDDAIDWAKRLNFEDNPKIYEHVEDDVLKFEFYGNEGDGDKIELILNQVKVDDWNFARMDSHRVEVTQKGVSKGDGILHFCKIFNIDIKNTMSIGDSANDHSMFEVTGHSYAMGSSPEITKSKAKKQTDRADQNGLGKAIKNFMSSIS